MTPLGRLGMWIGLFVGIALGAGAEVTAVRRFSYEGTWPRDGSGRVTMNLQGNPNETVRLEEHPPAGWTIRGPSPATPVVSGGLVWDLTLQEDGTEQATYNLIPTAQAQGEHPFSGSVNGVPIVGKAAAVYGRYEAGYQYLIDNRLPEDLRGIRGIRRSNYYVYFPKGYEEPGKKWPLLMFFHGNMGYNIPPTAVRSAGPPKYAANPDKPVPIWGLDGFPFFVVSPHSPDSAWNMVDLKGILDQVVADYPIEPERVYLTGLSRGGATVWDFSAYCPDRIAAMIPISGFTDTRVVKDLVHMPIWIFHGDADRVVSIKGNYKLRDALLALGGNVKMTVYPNATHDVWTRTYANPEIYYWLLAHRLHSEAGEWREYE